MNVHGGSERARPVLDTRRPPWLGLRDLPVCSCTSGGIVRPCGMWIEATLVTQTTVQPTVSIYDERPVYKATLFHGERVAKRAV